jgi:hypothetical protein
MTCHRCHGLLVNEQFALITHYDLRAESGFVGSTLRCINCGYVEDSVVRANYLSQSVADQPVGARTRATYSSTSSSERLRNQKKPKASGG